MRPREKTIVMLYETFTFGGLENYMLSVRKMCQEEGLRCFLVSIQKFTDSSVYSLSEGEFQNIRFPIYATSFAKMLMSIKPSLVHSQSYYSLALSSLLKPAFGFRTMCTIHNPLSQTERQGLLRSVLPRLLSPDMLIGVSQYSLDETLRSFRIRARNESVIYNWVDTKRFALAERKKHNHILFAGRLDSQKKVEMLPPLVRVLREKTPQIRLHVCGDGPLSHVVSGVDGIDFHGKVDNNTLVKLLQESALLVLPTRYEGMPFVVLESLACGTPVVASPVGGIPEIARISYGCFLADDDAFPDTVENVLGMGIDYRRVHDEAAENFSYRRAKRELIGAYRSLLEVPRRS